MAPRSPLDGLYRKVAKKVLTETVHVKKGESVTVEAWNNGVPFARHVVAEARAMGCTAVLLFEDESAYVEGVRRAPPETLGEMGKQELALLSATDAYVFVPGQAIGPWSKTLKPAERADSTRYNSAWYDAAEKAKLRGARLTFGYVGKDMAKMLGMSIERLVATQLRASLADSAGLAAAAGKLTPRLVDGALGKVMTGGDELRLTFGGELSVQDGVVDSGDLDTGNNMTYMPSGLVSKEVDPTSASGAVRMGPSLTKYGVVEETTLRFSEGVLTGWEGRGRKKLDALLGPVGPEKRRLTLLNVGLNPQVKLGVGRDAFARGTVTIGGFGFTAVAKAGSLSADGSSLVSSGRLA